MSSHNNLPIWSSPVSRLFQSTSSSSPNTTNTLSLTSLFKNATVLAHAEDSDIMDWEGMTITKAMLAGSLAGVTEHVCMFPIDTIKTRMQTASVPGAPSYTNVIRAIKDITKTEGFSRLYRGVPVTFLGAVPSHAAYFGTYEAMKLKLGSSRAQHTPVANMFSGISATLAHDAISTPMDVVKQKMQVYNSKYTNIIDCIKNVWRTEGMVGFYQSYPATVMLNIPYMAVHFATYEGMHTLLHDSAIDDTPIADILSGACAGALGGLLSNPLDVLKTRMQTQTGDRMNTIQMIKHMYTTEGIKCFGKGASARMMLFTPSAAICWTVYEGLKRFMIPNYEKNGLMTKDNH